MRIAQVAPLIETVPPKTYGGTERVVHYLTEELVRQGHDVTLFACGDSLTNADHVAVVQESLRCSRVPRDPIIWHQRQLMEVLRMADKFDIIHFHTDFSHFSVMRYLETPHITTLHGRLDLPDFQVVFDEFPDMPVVSISDSQRAPIKNANWVGTVYNGTPGENFDFRPTPDPDEYFAFLGRFSPEKGPERAIEIAKRLGVKLKMAAKIDKVDEEYFAERIKPQLDDPLIEYIGEVNENGKNRLLGGAKALLFPIDWPEPFGLVMTESMACGTPVIAFRNGSVDEVMKDRVSGYIVNSVDEAVDAARNIDNVSRRGCRVYFQSRFDVEPMAHGYLEVYKKLVAPQKTIRLPSRRRIVKNSEASVSVG
ncbi:GDP-mannose-dependent alpha-(1-2)-phosphatidylinositol mannosyltransferase [Novipirellula aureliae]|uniref:GDP-mannose-dependent alpha-(1-2)-phosphatidylinositol mannosyltransferase n=1 Tax=Novipirellula aureliae TaxID=2527966 RepID=A0A5C6E3N1_9BACT|nr:glycosyltransferase family 4 protein [Novipirellula aureliae]TWU43498.1 GDP-mannose-dependent alpha-(1-2)-phosphatidylinositol mannosyltransferase [Novipirellula aureliae]